ncbi:hypothetical protein LTR67_009174 [Exophiala xenobiotica]|jgi:hypothetical protein
MKSAIYISLFLAAGLDLASARPLKYHNNQNHGREAVSSVYHTNQDHGRRDATVTYRDNQNHGRDVAAASIDIRQVSHDEEPHGTFSAIVGHFLSLGGPDGIMNSAAHILDRS